MHNPRKHISCGQLDVLARMPLWRDGLDYNHGTGHGVGVMRSIQSTTLSPRVATQVGCYLNVHEGPQGISRCVKPTAERGSTENVDVPMQSVPAW